MKQSYLTRQMDIIPTKLLSQEIHIIGAGAIGSFVALNLAKMGFTNMTVYDGDTVAEENMSCQWYRHTDIGKNKVDALSDLIHDFTGERIDVIPKHYLSGRLSGIVVSSVDCMSVRTTIYNNLRHWPSTQYLVDPRMSAEYALLYTMNMNKKEDVEDYEKTLYTNENSVQERCTAKSTMYTSTMLAGLVAKAIKDIVTGNPHPRTVNWNIATNWYECFNSDWKFDINTQSLKGIEHGTDERTI